MGIVVFHYITEDNFVIKINLIEMNVVVFFFGSTNIYIYIQGKFRKNIWFLLNWESNYIDFLRKELNKMAIVSFHCNNEENFVILSDFLRGLVRYFN